MISSKGLFSKIQLGGIVLKNRFIRSATFEALSNDNGVLTPRLNQCYETLAKGEVGLLVTGGVYPTLKGRGHRTQLGLVNDEQQAALAKTVVNVHEKNCLICVQLNHAGVSSKPKLNGGFVPEGPSKTSKMNEAMSRDTIMEVIESFVSASKRVYASGADAIQLHAAHGYLLGEFISPLWNKRIDEFGGDVEGRFRIVKLIAEGIRSVIPTSFPLYIKMNGHDVENGGVTLETAIQVAKLAEKAKFDALEISGGSGRKPYSIMGNIDFDYIFKDPKKREAMRKRMGDIHFRPTFNLEYASEIKKHVQIPIISIGGFRTLKEMEKAIENNDCDAISLSRPFIRNPNLIKDFRLGKADLSTCVSCNRCFFNCMGDNPMKCLYPY